MTSESFSFVTCDGNYRSKMEKILKEQIVKSAAAVKRKVKMIKDIKDTNNMALETIFKPIADPLNLLTNKNENKPMIKKPKHNSNLTSSTSDLNELNSEEDYSDCELSDGYNKTLVVPPSDNHNVSEQSFKSIQSSPSLKNQSLSWSRSSEVMTDVPFGVRNERGKLLLGNTRVFDNDEVLTIGTISIHKTIGLDELLYKKKPNLDVVTDDDLQNYKLLLIETNAHRRNFKSSKPINSNKGFKYTNIIKPLFKFSRNATISLESIPTGKGIPLYKKVKENTDYVYWDNPNELVGRLKLLLASQAAGNTGVNNEIIAIVEELYEAGIINVELKELSSGKLSSIISVVDSTRQQ